MSDATQLWADIYRASTPDGLCLYLLTQDAVTGTDTYDSAIVCAASEDEARRMHPGDQAEWFAANQPRVAQPDSWLCGTWVSSPDQVKATLIGIAAPGVKSGLVLASFNAG
jgi:hypothetical protein